MTLRILSDSETARKTNYTKEVDEFTENGLTASRLPQGGEQVGRRQDVTGQTREVVTSADYMDQAGLNQAMSSKPDNQE